MSFVVDFSSYSDEQLVSPELKRLQGPALMLGSSKSLSDTDLERIKGLGDSDKHSKFDSAGRFGVGLNAFYVRCQRSTGAPTIVANVARSFPRSAAPDRLPADICGRSRTRRLRPVAQRIGRRGR